MRADAFSKQHPAYLISGMVCGGAYYLLLHGHKGLRMILGMIPMFFVLTFINPLFNTYGNTVLFTYFNRPYTLEALLYGTAVAAVFVEMLLWFGCYNAVLTSDKFTSLFGNLIPALSLLLVMVLRMIPNFMRKAQQISGARSSIGKGSAEQDGVKEKLMEGMTVLGALTSWALEGSIVTADSMRSRGYGTAKRSSFMLYAMTSTDWALLLCEILLTVLVIILGDTTATYTPVYYIAPISGVRGLGLVFYTVYLLIPTILHIKEAAQWRISISKI